MIVSNGGHLAPAWKPGQSGNPLGRPPKREYLAREYAARVGAEGLLELARQGKARKHEIAKALIDAATDRSHKGHIAAQALYWRLLGMADRKLEIEQRNELTVQVRKVRVMREDEGRVIDVKQKNGEEPA